MVARPPLRLGLLASALAAALAAGCKAPDGDYCRTSADCRDRSETKIFCDIAGRFGPAHSCIKPPDGYDGGPPDTGEDVAEDLGPADTGADTGADKPADTATDKGSDKADTAPDVMEAPPAESPMSCMASSECPEPGKPICVSMACAACTDSAQCADRNPDGPARMCDTGSGRCVECAGPSDCTDPMKAVCDNGTCRGCGSDGECPGAALCDEGTGRCAQDAEVIFVGATGCDDGASAPGSPATPYCTVGRALAQDDARVWVVVAAGTYMESMAADAGDGERTRIVTSQGKTVELRAAADGPVVSIAGNFKLTLDRITIAGDGTGDLGANVDGANGISCAGLISIPELTVLGSTIKGAKGYGIDAYNCTVGLDRVQILQSNNGGMRLSNSGVAASNTVIAKSGGAGVVTVGLEGASKLLVNCTIADNKGPGLDCGFAADVENSIVFLNASAATGTCNFAWSDVQDMAPPGDGNYSADPVFKNIGKSDYHLGVDFSPCVDKGGTGNAPDHDLDGEPRPKGSKIDTGADEF